MQARERSDRVGGGVWEGGFPPATVGKYTNFQKSRYHTMKTAFSCTLTLYSPGGLLQPPPPPPLSRHFSR